MSHRRRSTTPSVSAKPPSTARAPFRLIAAVLRSDVDAKRVLDALDAAGYVCAPIQPTPEMLKAGWAGAHDEDAAETWREMIEIAQQHQASNGNSGGVSG
jgi:hypothetical protein